ncbi:MAG TPA: hypothetical protein VMW49_06510 [Candidatus Dormibacteraeota bacterium]|nr:hypothetical protein [Candidatus Dormibacteraeota bacterium]
MDSAQRPARYRSSQAYVALFTYRDLGLDDRQFLADQFGVDLRVQARSGRQWEHRVQAVCTEIDALPVQAKDLIRHAVEQIRIQGDEAFVPGTTGTWASGVLRINADAPSLLRKPRPNGVLQTTPNVLRSTILHECGHVLVEDPRIGLPLRDYVRLVAAAGWLPDPREDPVVYGPCGESLDSLTEHYLSALQKIDSSWEPERPVGSYDCPGTFQLDRDMMAAPPIGPRPERPARPSLGLWPPRELTGRLAKDWERGAEGNGLQGCGLSRAAVERTANRRPAISDYAQAGVAETPAELFRCLYQPTLADRTRAEVLREARRCLIGPWRQAERAGPPRGLAPGILAIDPGAPTNRSYVFRPRGSSRSRE